MSKTNDFISDFFQLTADDISPEIFRRWSAISLIAGALERRVWVRTGNLVTFPNLYVLLVAPPGVGKFIVETVRQLWEETMEPGTKLPVFHVGPDSMTKASLIDTLAKSKTSRMVSGGQLITYHSLLVAAEEFSVLLPAYDMEYIGVLNAIYNNKPMHKESRRHGPAQKIEIEFPQLNLLGGVQPSFLASVLPEDAWATGFARRIIMIYSNEVPLRDIFQTSDIPVETRRNLLAKLGRISQLYGEINWSPEAQAKFSAWHLSGGHPQPSHSKLSHYIRNRSMNIIKLCAISAISRTLQAPCTIELIDLERAIAWLLEAEKLMPDIFRDMIGKSDWQIIEEMHYFVTALYLKNKSKPVDGGLIYQFLAQRVPSDKPAKIMELAERSNVLARVAGTENMWIPRPRHMQTPE